MSLRVLIVDDDAAFRAMLAQGLGDAYEVHQAATGADAICLASEILPNIAVLDVNMPGMNGYELCNSLKADLPDLRVVFISGDDTPEKRIAAYDAGADDFMAKPFRIIELTLKLDLLNRVLKDAQRLKEEMKSANDMAMLAITNTGEMGGVIDFIKRTAGCMDVESLLRALVTATASTFRVIVSAQVTLGEEQKTLNSIGRSSPLEAEMLRCQACDAERIYSAGRRMMVNYPRVTLLIKDMPIDDADRCGRLRDHMAILVEAAETRLNGIALEQQTRIQQTITLQTIASIQQVIASLEKQYRQQEVASQSVFDELKAEIDNALLFLGLTDNQEAKLMDMIGNSVDKASAISAQGLALEDKFAVIIGVLAQLQQTEAKPEILANAPDESIILF